MREARSASSPGEPTAVGRPLFLSSGLHLRRIGIEISRAQFRGSVVDHAWFDDPYEWYPVSSV